MPSGIFRENRNFKKIAVNNQNETVEILGTHNKKKGLENLTLTRQQDKTPSNLPDEFE